MINFSKIAFKVIFYLVLFTFLLSLWGYYSATHPLRLYSSNTPKDYDISFNEVDIITKDNIRLRAWYVASEVRSDKAIVLLHGYGADKGNILLSRLFLQKNYNLLFVDFRYFGQSDGKYSTAGLDEVNDLDASVEFLKNLGIKKIGVWGLSMGGAVAIMAAEHNKDINAIVMESSYASLAMMADQYFRLPGLNIIIGKIMRWWGLLFLGKDLHEATPAESIQNVKQPILLIHSKADSQISYENAEMLQEKAKHNKQFEVLIFQNARHGEVSLEMQKRILEFFNNYL